MWYDDYYDDNGGHWDDDNDKDKFLSGTIAKKTQGSETKNKGRTSAHCLASRSCDGLLHVRRREEALEVTDSCF